MEEKEKEKIEQPEVTSNWVQLIHILKAWKYEKSPLSKSTKTIYERYTII